MMNNEDKIFMDAIHARNNKRVADLNALGMKFDGDSFIGKEDLNRDFNVHSTEITCDSDEEWDGKISKMKAELERRRNV